MLSISHILHRCFISREVFITQIFEPGTRQKNSVETLMFDVHQWINENNLSRDKITNIIRLIVILPYLVNICACMHLGISVCVCTYVSLHIRINENRNNVK